jgi:hypothetical protein
MIQSLRTREFVAAAAPLMRRPEYCEIACRTFVSLLDSAELTKAFVAEGGAQGLSQMVRSGAADQVKAAVVLAPRAAEAMNDAARRALVGDLLAAGQTECAVELIDAHRIDAAALVRAHPQGIIAASEASARACQLAAQALDIGAIPPDDVTVALALRAQSVPLVERLLANPRFLSRLAAPAAAANVAAAALTPEGRHAALAIACCIPQQCLEHLGSNTAFVQAALGIADVERSAYLLAPLARDQAGAAQVLKSIDKFSECLASLRVLQVLANVAVFFGKELLALEWLVRAITDALSLRKLLNVGANLAIVSGLANTSTIVAQQRLMKALTRLLGSAECDPLETHILMQVFAKISPFCSLIDFYQFLLQAAESQNPYGLFALAALANQSLPKLATRYSVRLIAIASRFLESDDDAHQKAAADVVSRMARKKPYMAQITEVIFPGAMQKALFKTSNPEVFESLLQSAKLCGLRVGQQVAQAAEQLATRIVVGEDSDGAARAQELRSRIVALANELI